MSYFFDSKIEIALLIRCLTVLIGNRTGTALYTLRMFFEYDRKLSVLNICIF